MEIKKIALTFGIAILFTLFIVFLVDAIYESPKYEDYCNQTYGPHLEPLNCTNFYNGNMINSCYSNEGEVRYNYDERGCPKEAYCDYCSKEFNDDNAKYNKNIFFISAIVAILAILAGLYLPKNVDAIASGFMFGGILVLLQGTVRVFEDLGKYSRVVILGIELILLIWIGYKKVSDKKQTLTKKKSDKK